LAVDVIEGVYRKGEIARAVRSYGSRTRGDILGKVVIGR
jgi:hypothetical protein